MAREIRRVLARHEEGLRLVDRPTVRPVPAPTGARRGYRGGLLAALLTGGRGRGGGRPTISARQFEGGIAWRADYGLATGAIRASDPSADRVSGASPRFYDQLSSGAWAERRFAKAAARLGAPLARLAFRVVVEDVEPSRLAREADARTDAVTYALREALDELADFYGIAGRRGRGEG